MDAPFQASFSDISFAPKLNGELRGMHLVPQAYAKWFNHHCIYKYYDNDANISTLPQDQTPSDSYVCLFFTKWHIGLAKNYHMRAAKVPNRIQGYALFARFTWAMIQTYKRGEEKIMLQITPSSHHQVCNVELKVVVAKLGLDQVLLETTRLLGEKIVQASTPALLLRMAFTQVAATLISV
ncbi:hypothetical protein DFS33DRAFT_1271032 [Desarmillaria ectypa]|nr:hypothetical protein DFS33DRAFT_1271032 [Desarmillaria ectypa]